MNFLKSLYLLFVQVGLGRLLDDIVVFSLKSYCWQPLRFKYLQYK